MRIVLLLLFALLATATTTTQRPSKLPTKTPTLYPSASSFPSKAPTYARPSQAPTLEPTYPEPSAQPSYSAPSLRPTLSTPTEAPTTSLPSAAPTSSPTQSPSVAPTTSPTTSPTLRENGAYFTLTLFNVKASQLVAAPTRAPSLSPTVLRITRAPTRMPNSTNPRPLTRRPTQARTTRLASTLEPTYSADDYYYSTTTTTTNLRGKRRRRQRQLAGNPLAADIPNTVLPSDNLVNTIGWEHIYQGVHCLVDFFIQAGGLTYSDLYLGTSGNPECTADNAVETCFPVTFEILVSPTGRVGVINSTACGIPQCPTCDEVCVFVHTFDSTVRPLFSQEKLFLLASTNSTDTRSVAKNLLPGVVKHTLSPSSRFCRNDMLDQDERTKIFDETGGVIFPPSPLGTKSPTVEGWTYAPTLEESQLPQPPPFVQPGNSDVTTATVLGVLGSLGLLLALFLVVRRQKRRKKKKLQQLMHQESLTKQHPVSPNQVDPSGQTPKQQQKQAEYMEDEYAINLSHLLIGQPIGSGSSGQIYAARYEGSDVCIKEILVRGDIILLKKEFDTLRRLKNPHVIQLFGFAIANTMHQQNVNDSQEEEGGGGDNAYQPDFPRFLLMMELMDTSLDKLIFRKQQLLNSEEDVVTNKEHLDWALDIAKQVCLGLRYIHGKEVLHCDVKPHNILLDRAGTVKLCDLGIAKVINATKLGEGGAAAAEQQQGTVSYMSPELLGENKLTKAVDVYAYGIVVWQCVHLQPPHPNFHSHQEIIEQVLYKDFRPPIDARLDLKIAGLIQRCWDKNPTNRPTFSTILHELNAISNLENKFGTVYLETLFQVGDSVLVFTLKNQQGNESELMKGTIDSSKVNPSGGFVYNVVLQDGSKIYALHPSDMLLQKPTPAAAVTTPPPTELVLPPVTTIGDAITRVMEEGLEVRRKKKTFPRLPGFPQKKHSMRTVAGSSNNNSARKKGGDEITTVRSQSDVSGMVFDSRIKSHSSAPAFAQAIRLNKHVSNNNTNNTPPSTGTPVPSPLASPAVGLSLNTESAMQNNIEQTFKYDGNSFVFNSGMRLQESGITPNGAKSVSGNSNSSLVSGTTTADNNMFTMRNDATRNKYEDRKIIRVGRLGQGDAGTVYSGIHEETMEILAVKEVTKFFDRDVRMQAKRELEALLELQHENIVGLKSVYFNAGHSSISFVLEYVLGGSLKDLMSSYYEGMNELMLKRIASDLTSALKYCHENKIVHLDVKPANVLLTLNGSAKLSDFGLARIFRDEKNVVANTFIGSSLYMSPERMQGQPYSFPADIWGLGLTIAEACVGKYPISSGNKLMNILADFRGHHHHGNESALVNLPSDLSPQAHQFIMDCLVNDPTKRPTCQQLETYQWIEDAEDSKQQAVPERSNRASKLLLGEFLDSYVHRFIKDLPATLTEEQRVNLMDKFHLTEMEIQLEYEEAMLRGNALSNTLTSQDSGSQANSDAQSHQQPAATGNGGMAEYQLSET